MQFTGIWAAKSGSAAFRVVPKCACSTVGQLLYFSEYGQFHDGDIHSQETGLLKWEQKQHRIRIAEIVMSSKSTTFTCVRNPFSRILSAFFDKIAGAQPDGTRYRGGAIHSKLEAYGVNLETGFDQIESFRNFLRFAADTIRSGSPMAADIHWMPMHRHLSDLVKNGGRYDAVISTENLTEDLPKLFTRIGTPHIVDSEAIPRFNEGGLNSPKCAFPVEDFFDDFSTCLMQATYDADFRLFHFDRLPGNCGPSEDVDLSRLNHFLLQ